jgi:hypothetical protein
MIRRHVHRDNQNAAKQFAAGQWQPAANLGAF